VFLAKHAGLMNILKVKFVVKYNTNTVFDCIFEKIYYDSFTTYENDIK